MKISRHKGALGISLILFGTVALAAAHGNDGHHAHGHDHPHHHMEEMMRQKEQIPDQYRVMDRTPIVPDAASLQRGGELFATHCAHCHGAEGEGDGPAAAALETPPASFLDLEHSDIFGPGEKYWIITKGFPDAGMPGFEGQIAPADRWHLVNYIYHLQNPLRDGGGGHRH